MKSTVTANASVDLSVPATALGTTPARRKLRRALEQCIRPLEPAQRRSQETRLKQSPLVPAASNCFASAASVTAGAGATYSIAGACATYSIIGLSLRIRLELEHVLYHESWRHIIDDW